MKRNAVGIAVIGVLIGSVSWAARANGPEQEVIGVENAWKEAVVQRDAKTLQRLYADEYTSTDREGAVWTKAEDIQIDTTGNFRLETFTLNDLSVRVYGDVAIVTGRNTTRGTFLGRPASSDTRFTDVFVKRVGRWQIITSQSTDIAKE
jgi:ketosteroid isomerase-like protein